MERGPSSRSGGYWAWNSCWQDVKQRGLGEGSVDLPCVAAGKAASDTRSNLDGHAAHASVKRADRGRWEKLQVVILGKSRAEPPYADSDRG